MFCFLSPWQQVAGIIFFFTIQQVVLDGYLMTSMGLKEDLAGDRAERMQEKNTSAGMFSGSESWDRLWY